MELAPADVSDATEWVVDLASRVSGDAWTTVDTDVWSPRRTLDHLVDAMLLYSGYVATRATGRITPLRNGDANAGPEALLDALRLASSILTTVLDAMPDEVRAFHPSGSTDRTGWIGMACTELLVHGFDIATTASVSFVPPDDRVAHDVVERVLPWAPAGHSGWSRLLWATGRAPLGALAPQDSDWWWQSAPLTDWDGRPRHRDTPAQW